MRQRRVEEMFGFGYGIGLLQKLREVFRLRQRFPLSAARRLHESLGAVGSHAGGRCLSTGY